MSNAPITVSGRALPEAVTKNIIKGPIVLSELIGDSGDTTPSVGFNQAIYKVRLVANGKTFNMLLPPSIESKHPGRSNPLQLPGLQIESASNISKLKIPGFFPIYQHLGVESLYVSMSGMFTGYDGEAKISTAGDWEGWANPEEKGGQDAYTAACELFDFAVKNKALTTVTISTSDGSFEPKKSTSDNFRDERANIRFKGYIKELKQIYIRQDRVYYMLKFEIVDLGNGKKECLSNNKNKNNPNNNLLNNITRASLGIGTNLLTSEDIAYLTPSDLEKAKTLINKINNGKQINNNDIDSLDSRSLRSQIVLYANEKGQNVDNLYSKILNESPAKLKKEDLINNPQRAIYLSNKYKRNILTICNKLNDSCEIQNEAFNQNEELINKEFTNKKLISNSNQNTNSDINALNPPTNVPQSNNKVTTDINELSIFYGNNDRLIKDLRKNNGVFKDSLMIDYANINGSTSATTYTYIGNARSFLSVSPVAVFETNSGDKFYLAPNPSSDRYTLVPY